VFENGVLRRTFRPKRDEVTGVGGNCIMRSLNYTLPQSLIRMIKSRWMRWALRVAQMGEERYIWDIGGKARRKETTRKTKT
jgi:hypothetical protein